VPKIKGGYDMTVKRYSLQQQSIKDKKIIISQNGTQRTTEIGNSTSTKLWLACWGGVGVGGHVAAAAAAGVISQD
jgi:hypothetical protein